MGWGGVGGEVRGKGGVIRGTAGLNDVVPHIPEPWHLEDMAGVLYMLGSEGTGGQVNGQVPGGALSKQSQARMPCDAADMRM